MFHAQECHAATGKDHKSIWCNAGGIVSALHSTVVGSEL
jgi:hypothetical protein